MRPTGWLKQSLEEASENAKRLPTWVHELAETRAKVLEGPEAERIWRDVREVAEQAPEWIKALVLRDSKRPPARDKPLSRP